MLKKNVVGVFASSFEALRTIDSMKQDGIDKSHLYVIAHDDYETRLIEEKSGVAVDHNITEEENRSFWNELKSFFTGNSSEYSAYSDYLLGIGMTRYDVEQYAKEVEGGKILVLVDSEYDEGRTGVLTSENISERKHAVERHFPPDYNLLDHSEEGLLDEEQTNLEQNDLRNSMFGSKKMLEKEYEEDENPFYNR
ncbi:general stress protein [Bacillus sp. FJAT-49732]|uniref:General stress protein n=1 Tax=Lederbergia citrisecunda TaxID=2833583 RepID=A0A942TP96_9BACI|nr:general stress protein [Lederbergia citrisecunda]MBS4199794.1 general stress protein [Lederbergia citrisecunda]